MSRMMLFWLPRCEPSFFMIDGEDTIASGHQQMICLLLVLQDALLRDQMTQLLHQLYDRNSRREFCPMEDWLQVLTTF